MNPEKVGKFIKELRQKNNLTQRQFADMYNVTYQAVSKWENGINIPEISLLRQISKDFGVSIEDLLDGKSSNNKTRNNYLIIFFVITAVVVVIILLGGFKIYFDKKAKDKNIIINDITAKCEEFNVSGTLVYDNEVVYMRISNIEHCGTNNQKYAKIECILYEKYGSITNKISECVTGYNETLEEHLKKTKLTVDNYATICRKIEDGDFYLEINATDNDNKTTVFKIPLDVNSSCKS